MEIMTRVSSTLCGAWVALAALPAGAMVGPPRAEDVRELVETDKGLVWLVADPRHPRASLITKLPKGARLVLQEDQGSWLRVRDLADSAVEGFVMDKLTSRAGVEVIPSTIPELPDATIRARPPSPLVASEAALPRSGAASVEGAGVVPVGDIGDPSAASAALAASATVGAPAAAAPPPLDPVGAAVPGAASSGAAPPSAAAATVDPMASPVNPLRHWPLALVTVLGLGALAWVKRRDAGAETSEQPGLLDLRVLETRSLGKGRLIAAIQASDRLLVVSCGPEGMELLSEDAPLPG